MNLYFHPLNPACKSITGGIKCNQTLTLRVFFEHSEADSAKLNLALCKDGEEPVFFRMEKIANGFEISFRIASSGLYFYWFSLEGGGCLSCGELQEGRFTSSPAPYLLTVFEEDFHAPEAFKGGVFYQIFPDRFFRSKSVPLPEDERVRRMRRWGDAPEFRPDENGEVKNNDFFGGNLKGIEEKLGYLKSLGVTAIYLNPIFEAASNHRYDTANFEKIDPLLGTEEDFCSLAKKAKAHGISLILDGVFNHVGADSVYFNRYGTYPSLGAYESNQSPYADWFTFRRFPDEYDCWWGIKSLPAINEDAPSYQNFLFQKDGLLRRLLRLGASGFRLDVADELPDDFLKKLRKTVKEENENALILGEVWEDASDKISYSVRRKYLQGEELDGVMNYPLQRAIVGYLTQGDCKILQKTLFALLDHYPKQALDCTMNLLSTHDTPRILSVLAGKDFGNLSKEQAAKVRLTGVERKSAEQKLKLAAVLLYTLPGIPCIYYGDEEGLEGGPDPFCRGCFDWERSECELVEFYRALGRLREKFRDVFAEGAFCEIYADKGLYAFERRAKNKAVYTIVNCTNERFVAYPKTTLFDELKDKTLKEPFGIGPQSFGIFSCQIR